MNSNLENVKKLIEVGKELERVRPVMLNRKGFQAIEQLVADYERMQEVLNDCWEYFDDRADAEYDLDGFVPNEEMKLAQRIDEILPKLEQENDK